jgi:hypothetical protein
MFGESLVGAADLAAAAAWHGIFGSIDPENTPCILFFSAKPQMARRQPNWPEIIEKSGTRPD